MELDLEGFLEIKKCIIDCANDGISGILLFDMIMRLKFNSSKSYPVVRPFWSNERDSHLFNLIMKK